MISAENLALARHRKLSAQLQTLCRKVPRPEPLKEQGSLVRMVGIKLEAVGCSAPIGSRCLIVATDKHTIEAEVVGFSDDSLYLMPEGNLDGIQLGARVIPMRGSSQIAVDEQLLGRVIDGGGRLLDDGPAISCRHHSSMRGEPINPLKRRPISEPLDVGVRAVNALLTIGKGQRLGLFAGSGVGKSTLLGMMTKHTEADVIVVGLIGERGREVREFVEDILGEEGLKKAIIVATPADDPPLMRVQGAWRATAIAEYFRAQGKDVLLLMDSVTRFAQAQREIGLAVGEPPVSKGYPPSVFSLLPALIERAGNSADAKGSITAIYTVLVEGDDHNEPIADAARAILDGHIMLSRQVADSGLFPAIDIDGSISRSMMNIVPEQQMLQVQQLKALYATYQQNREMITLGAYQAGSDSNIDKAIRMEPAIRAFIGQQRGDKVDMANSLAQLDMLSKLFSQPAEVTADAS